MQLNESVGITWLSSLLPDMLRHSGIRPSCLQSSVIDWTGPQTRESCNPQVYRRILVIKSKLWLSAARKLRSSVLISLST